MLVAVGQPLGEQAHDMAVHGRRERGGVALEVRQPGGGEFPEAAVRSCISGRGAGLAAVERHLAKALAGAEITEFYTPITRQFEPDRKLTRLDEEDTISRVALTEERLAGLERNRLQVSQPYLTLGTLGSEGRE